MVEPIKTTVLNIVEPQCHKRVLRQDEVARRINLVRHLEHVNLNGEDRKYIARFVGINVAAIEKELMNLSIVEGRPISKKIRELSASLKDCRAVHRCRLTSN